MDKDELRAFMGRFMQMATGAAVLGIVAVADRTGLFRGLAGAGPLGIEAIAEKTGLQERYLREALSSLAAAEIVRYDPARQTFELPDEHAACLADESSPYFLAGWSQIVPALYGAIPGVVRAFREGGGVPFTAFGSDMVEGIARSNGPGTRILLTRKWLPAMPDVVARLEAGDPQLFRFLVRQDISPLSRAPREPPALVKTRRADGIGTAFKGDL